MFAMQIYYLTYVYRECMFDLLIYNIYECWMKMRNDDLQNEK